MLLELKNIKKYFPERHRMKNVVRAVDGVSLSIKSGENLSLVGESGCGKTTLGRVILKLLPVDSGQVIFDGTDITGLSSGQIRSLRKNIQMVFQDPFSSLDPRFIVKNIIGEAMIFDRMKKSEKEGRIRDLLTQVALPADILNRFPHEFSGGERQRIAIARGLINNPKLLILDEAVSSLDILVQNQIINLLLELQKKFNTTYIFISHNLRVARKIGTHIAVMHRGTIVELALAQELFNNPLHPYTKKLLLAATEYKTSDDRSEGAIFHQGDLIEKTKGHFVRDVPKGGC
ncbi:MAG: ATP-binding cassette domain-containing protein [Candidatus Omnitrophota bacterium]